MVKLPVPPVAEQRLIAGVLAPLHDKIELNHRMNRTLDEIAGALFRSWFIDYDPVYAKVDGRWKRGENLPGMPAHMWDIWPSELEESAIGEVPKGWPIRELQEVAEITQGSTPSTSIGEYWAPAELNWVTVKDLSEANSHVLVRTERRLSRAGVDRIGSEIVPAGTVLLSTGAPIGYTAITETPTALGTRVAAIRARSGGGNQFLIRWIQANSEALRDAANGTTFPQLLLGTLRELPIAAPGESILQAFETSLAPCHRLVAANEFENSTLGALHDVLLPKLLSGEIRVPIDGKA